MGRGSPETEVWGGGPAVESTGTGVRWARGPGPLQWTLLAGPGLRSLLTLSVWEMEKSEVRLQAGSSKGQR